MSHARKAAFACHRLIKTTQEFCGKSCQEAELDTNTTGNDLDVELMSVAGGMKIYVEYNSAKYSADFIKTFAKGYENVLRQFMSKDLISEIELLDDARKNLFDSFNATEVTCDDSQTVISLFNESVKNFSDNRRRVQRQKIFLPRSRHNFK